MDRWDEATDEELVAASREGDDRALEVLLLRYRGLVRRRAAAYFLTGADRDDLAQEGMIGLYKAAREFDTARGAGFRTFADLCISRQVLTAVRTASRHKHGPLNDYVSLHRPLSVDEDHDCTLAEVLAAPAHDDPLEQVLFAERSRALSRHVTAVLSDLESEVLRLHVDGRNYREIARVLQRQAKSVDNALQRIKRKIDAHVEEWDAAVA